MRITALSINDQLRIDILTSKFLSVICKYRTREIQDFTHYVGKIRLVAMPEKKSWLLVFETSLFEHLKKVQKENEVGENQYYASKNFSFEKLIDWPGFYSNHCDAFVLGVWPSKDIEIDGCSQETVMAIVGNRLYQHLSVAYFPGFVGISINATCKETSKGWSISLGLG